MGSVWGGYVLPTTRPIICIQLLNFLAFPPIAYMLQEHEAHAAEWVDDANLTLPISPWYKDGARRHPDMAR
ncbi:hypothetical protein Syun_029519 [Stephania yunnanensis]|uniref:Uncharacterized protein n=1 Tax=Stephania yunnanensis TaxID=152371 RepID=A0AAP0E849_9MAGN